MSYQLADQTIKTKREFEMSITGLKALLGDHEPEEFFCDGIPSEPFAIHDLSDSIAVLRNLPFLNSLNDLLDAWTGQIQVHLPDVKDESSSINASASDAKKLFANGMALLFNNAERLSPVLRDWLATLKSDLGLPHSAYARCMAYATPSGKGTAAHFDQNINFVLQLHGIKRWWVAPNRNVVNPTQRFTIGQPVDPELASYIDSEMPTALPMDHREIVLKPGSLLFVPRGYWHSTEASGEALALNFTFSQPSWADLFTMALKSRLLLSPEWRELADGVSSVDPDRRMMAEQKLDHLLMELSFDVPNWRAADILGATEG